MKKWGLVIRVQESGPKRTASTDEQSKGPKMWYAIQSNVSEDSNDKDTYHEGTG